MKVEVIAKRGFGVTKKGGRAWLTREQAKVLVACKIAEYAPVEVVKPAPPPLAAKGTYQRRDMVAQSAGTVTSQASRHKFGDGKA
jgi:hypothetical protein